MRIGLCTLFALGSLACVSENGGTAVGNPTSMEPTLARTGVTLTRATLPVSRVSAVSCSSLSTDLDVHRFDLLERDPILMPAGLCRLVVVPAGPIELEGHTDLMDFTGTIDVPELELVAAEPVTATATVLEIGAPSWLDDETLGLGTVVLGPEHAAYGEIAHRLASETALWADSDRNGIVSEQERSAGPLAVVADYDELDDADETDDGEEAEDTGDDD